MALSPWAVILCKFNDVDIPPLSLSAFTNYISSGHGGLWNYWYDISYSQIDLSQSIVRGWYTMQYSFVTEGDKSRQDYIAEAKRLAAADGVDLSKYYGVIAFTNANVDGGNAGRDMAGSIGGTWGQIGWRWCNKCQTLNYIASGGGFGQIGPCPAGGIHDNSGSALYSLALNLPPFPGLNGWRWCQKCQGLNYSELAPGKCQAGGVHDNSASGDYRLRVTPLGQQYAQLQDQWNRCKKCELLNFGGNPPAPCPSEGVHDNSGSWNFNVVHYWSDLNVSNTGHETGHGYGLGHSWLATPEREYGNDWDIMGSGRYTYSDGLPYSPKGPGLDAPNLDFLGLFPAELIWTNAPTNPCETISLLPLNKPNLGYMAARISKLDRTYYVEYRQPTGWDRGFPRQAVLINEVRNWQWCNKCQELTFAGGLQPGPCSGGGTHDHAGSAFYTLFRDTPKDGQGNPLATQDNWQWCIKCQALTYSQAQGVCPADHGAHAYPSTTNWVLVHDTQNYGQNNWRSCSKCQALSYVGGTWLGPCPAGGQHTITGFDYDLNNDTRHSFLWPDANGTSDWQPGKVFLDKDRSLGIVIHSFGGTPDVPVATISIANIQHKWGRCVKCQTLTQAGLVNMGACPAGGQHLHYGLDYSLIYGLPGTAGQNDWKWCSKCFGLAYAGNVGVCQGGVPHNLAVSENYTLLHDTLMADAQSGWRWCSKCQCLHSSVLTNNVCFAGGSHSSSNSYDYDLIDV
jgi:hypothetical protein